MARKGRGVVLQILINHTPASKSDYFLNLNQEEGYSTLSNKRAGWNKMCKLENSKKFGNLHLIGWTQNFSKPKLGQKRTK